MVSVEAINTEAVVKLREALIAVYAAFSAYERPTSMHASSLRDADAIRAELCSAPLNRLSPEAIVPYANWAMTTVGDIEDYKHFLPRIIHLAATGGNGQPGLDPRLIASKLEYANWRSWSFDEQKVLERMFEAAWARARLQHPDDVDAEDWLCGSAMLGNEMEAGLAEWIADATPNSMAQLAHFLMAGEGVARGTGSWEDVRLDTRKQIVDWLCSDAVEAALIDAVDKVAESDLWRFDSAEAAVSLLKQVRWRD
jgi:hypothetical protein